MKSFRHVCAALVLTFALFGSAFAGDMNSPPVAAPGEMNAPPLAAPGDMSDPTATNDTQGKEEIPPGDVLNPELAIFLYALGLMV